MEQQQQQQQRKGEGVQRGYRVQQMAEERRQERQIATEAATLRHLDSQSSLTPMERTQVGRTSTSSSVNAVTEAEPAG